MPRGRMLNKSISKSEKVAKLSIEGALLFTWILPHTDVEGRLEADVWSIKAIVPFIDEITPNNIPKLLEEMVTAGLILYYGNAHKYLQVVDFCKHQKLRTDQESPSHIPEPTQQQSNNGVETELQPLKLSKVKLSKYAPNGDSVVVKNPSPKKPPKEHLDKIVTHYYQLKNITNDAQRANLWAWTAKSAKVLLSYASGDVDKVLRVLTWADKDYRYKNLDWKLQTIERNWHLLENEGKEKVKYL